MKILPLCPVAQEPQSIRDRMSKGSLAASLDFDKLNVFNTLIAMSFVSM
jgi:hypothetical protein